MKRYLGVAVILLGLALMINPAMAAITDTFTGGGSVISGTDPLGNPWVTQVATQDGTGEQTLIWGVPGYGLGETSSTFTGIVTDFHFSTLPEPGTGDQYKILATSQSLGGTTTETRFQVEGTSGSLLWNRVISADGYSVDFVAPSISSGIKSGTEFFVNIDFTPNPSITGLSLDDLYFQAHYSGTAVPLPPSVWLFGSGLLGLVGFRFRKNQA
jgi:hypothetical protein